jgi:hypothetical protein
VRSASNIPGSRITRVFHLGDPFDIFGPCPQRRSGRSAMRRFS